jgi:hypothetical protein
MTMMTLEDWKRKLFDGYQIHRFDRAFRVAFRLDI